MKSIFKKTEFFKKYGYLLFFPLSILFSELLLRVLTGHFFDIGLLFVTLFSVSVGLFATLFCGFCKNNKLNKLIAIIMSVMVFLNYGTQLVYYNIFNKYLVFYSLFAGGAKQLTTEGKFIETALINMWYCLGYLLLLLIPTIVLIVFGNKLFGIYKTTFKTKIYTALSALLIKWVAILLIVLTPSLNNLYYGIFSPTEMSDKFGVYVSETLDIKYNMLNIGGNGTLLASSDGVINSSNANIMDIDFDSLIKNEKDPTVKGLHNYFKNKAPTYKNEYTGIYKDYNLVMFTAEGFAPYAISKELTPTLYMMQQNGFNFTNYYNSPWTVSTSDGEYVECTGLIPKSGAWSFYETGKNQVFLPFSMPQQFLNSGVKPVYAYHNNTYTYYHRDISHPNLGYLYKGLGNGLNVKRTWPESDHEMIELTTKDYINKNKRFHAYYMTVSGHMAYDFKNNYQSNKYRELVKDLPYSENIKAYIACNIDLDRALERLIKDLKKQGVLDKTLIVISPDHTPYGLEDTGKDKYKNFNEILGHEVESTFELNKSVLLMYSGSMKKGITVTKPCSPLDIIPTLNNLFGFEYDSRMLMGKDIFSSSEGLVIFENKSFLTKEGKYFSATNKFVKNKHSKIKNEKEYVNSILQEVSNSFVASKQILETNYYKKAITSRTHIKGGLYND